MSSFSPVNADSGLMKETAVNIRALEPQANLENLKKQAKTLLKQAKADDAAALERFGRFFQGGEVLGLKRTQLVIAREYGFSSWNKLTEAVRALRTTPEQNTECASEHDDEFLKCFKEGDIEGAKHVLRLAPDLVSQVVGTRNYQAHRLLRAFVNANSGHCNKPKQLSVADLLISPKVREFRNAVLSDRIETLEQLISQDPQLVTAEFTCGRGISQAIHHFKSIAVARLLLDAGADINALTTVHFVGETPLAMQLRFGTPNCATFLLDAGADANRGMLKFMSTAVMSEMVPVLIRHGWNIDEGEGVRTLLHHDAAHGHRNKVQILLDHGANPNVLDANGQTPLHVAAARGKGVATIKALVSAGAKLDIQCKSGMTPLDIAREADNKSAMKALAEGS